VARPNRTRAKQLCIIGDGADSLSERQSYWHRKVPLLLASAFIAQAAAAQQISIAGTTVSDTPEISSPAAKIALATDATKAVTATRTALPRDVAGYHGEAETATAADSPSTPAASWPVAVSLKTTLRIWARRQGWPTPRSLTEADWAVDVPGSIPGSIEDALNALAAGFARSPTRPRIEISANHVILVSEVGAE